MPKSKKWFTARAAEGVAKIMINGVIGSDNIPDWFNEDMGRQSSRTFIKAVEDLGDIETINVDINTPGGDVAAGVAIYNYLKNHKAEVNTRVIGRAASIGSIIMLAGQRRTMGAGTSVMAHGPAAYLDGIYNAADIKAVSEGIDHITDLLASIYAIETNLEPEEIASILSEGDHYFTAEQALEKGFATDQDEELQAVACAEPDDFRDQLKAQAHINELEAENTSLKAQFDDIQTKHEAALTELDALRNPEAAGADYVIEACDKAELPVLAVEMIKQKLPQAIVDQRLALAKSVRDIAAAGGINADALLAHINDPIQMMRVAITEAKAEADQDLDHHSRPGPGKGKQPSAKAVYAQLNQQS